MTALAVAGIRAMSGCSSSSSDDSSSTGDTVDVLRRGVTTRDGGFTNRVAAMNTEGAGDGRCPVLAVNA